MENSAETPGYTLDQALTDVQRGGCALFREDGLTLGCEGTLLIRPEALVLIHDHREQLRQLSAEELKLLFCSALAAGYEMGYWFERARWGGVDVERIVLETVHSASFRARAAAIAVLGQLEPVEEVEPFVERIIEALADEYPQVRLAAIRVLERLRPGGEWREHLVHECYVPAGRFIMGEENKAHTVYLDAFYVGKYQVTNADYQRYIEDLGYTFDAPEGKADHPVVGISWYDARDYAEWAGMRLLTEAEWEKAASWDDGMETEGGRRFRRLVDRLASADTTGSSGRKRTYPWGDEFDGTRCNTIRAGLGDTTPVGKYSPQGDSPYGCADMVGNVWEWTSSLYKKYPYRADDGREDLSAPGPRVVRGGSFFSYAGVAYCAYRLRYSPYGRRSWFWGCRVGLTASS